MLLPSRRPGPLGRVRSLRRAVLARRRPLAALLAALAALVALRGVTAPDPPGVLVPVASRDLTAGTTLAAGDLRTVRLPPGRAPEGLVADATGRRLASPLRAGEPVTDVRLVGAALADAHPGLRVMPLRLPDPAIVDLLRVGDRIDLSASDPRSGRVAPVASAVLVLAVPPDAGHDADLSGRLIVAGIAPLEADAVAAASVREFLHVAFTR